MMKPQQQTAIAEAQDTWEQGALAKVLKRFPERREADCPHPSSGIRAEDQAAVRAAESE